MVNQKTLGQIPIHLLLLRNAAMTAVHQLERSPPGSFKVTDAVKFGIFFAIFKALSKCQNIFNPTRFGLRYPSMPAGMASNPWHWQGSSLKVQTKLPRNRWQEHWNLESGSSNHVSLNSWFSYYTDFVCLNKYQGHQVHSAPAAASVLAFLQKTYFGIAETLPHEWGA